VSAIGCCHARNQFPPPAAAMNSIKFYGLMQSHRTRGLTWSAKTTVVSFGASYEGVPTASSFRFRQFSCIGQFCLGGAGASNYAGAPKPACRPKKVDRDAPLKIVRSRFPTSLAPFDVLALAPSGIVCAQCPGNGSTRPVAGLLMLQWPRYATAVLPSCFMQEV
jgi:hypothetical protein